MRKFFFLSIFILAFSCSPKIGSKIFKEYSALPINAYVLVLSIGDDQQIVEDKVGEIKAVDSGFSSNCSYAENLELLKKLAREKGANLIKITQHKPSNGWSTCDRLYADIYKVNDYKVYENEIEWTEGRKLIWEDFKGVPNVKAFPIAAAVSHCGFGFQSNIMTLTKDGKFFVRNIFTKNLSWVLPDQVGNDYLLKHEQIHFDISEIYSRMLRKELLSKKIDLTNIQDARNIFNEIRYKYEERQKYYDSNTKHSLNKTKQKEWVAIIEIELAKYDKYKL